MVPFVAEIDTLTTLLSSGSPDAFFDNIPDRIDSDELAKAMTDRYRSRLLGGNREIDLEPQCQWIFTAINIRMSGELVRRCGMIEMDTGLADPTQGRTFKHDDILKYASENRGRLIWACLTLIQNWIAKGGIRWKVRKIASFENWSEIIGGILDAAGIGGFLANLDRFKSYAESAKENGVQLLMDYLANEFGLGTVFRPGGTSGLVREGDRTAYGDGKVLSIKDILNAAGGTQSNSGSALPLLIDGWGYSSEDGSYLTAARIGEPFKDACRRPWLCEVDSTMFEIAFTHGKDKNGDFYVMTKRAEIKGERRGYPRR